MDDLQAADYRLPPNADVNEFKGFKMTLPPSCGATTPMQLAVTMSHLKVILPPQTVHKGLPHVAWESTFQCICNSMVTPATTAGLQQG